MDTTLADDVQSVASVPAYRRNGKLFSCEPCRRGKLRCDHTSPTCGRCARRNKAEQCVYVTAPMTQSKTRDSPGAGPRRTSIASPRVPHPVPYLPAATTQVQRQHSGLVSPPSSTGAQQKRLAANTSAYPADGQQALKAFPIWHPELDSMPPTPGELTRISSDAARSGEATCNSSTASYASPENTMSKAGFLGPTSYSAVFTENQNSGRIYLEPENPDDAPSMDPISTEKIQQGAEVLALLRDLPLYNTFTERCFDVCEGLINIPAIHWTWVEELWNEWGQILTDGNPDQLRSLSELVWRNTRQPLKTNGQMTAREWAQAASGRRLRWEVIGSILAMTGLTAANLSGWDTIFDSIRDRYVDRATFAERMRRASGYCLCFCYESEVLNDVYITFMYEDLVLVECLKGEAHYSAWQRTGEVCDAIVAMGLHQGNPRDADTPFWLSEMRRRLFVSAYGRDKAVATFLGRPPRLSYRYCRIELPLDLGDSDILLEGAELDAALSALDVNGWNTGGYFGRTTWLRAWAQHCRIREDILEIALGSGDDDITLRAEQIRLDLQRLQRSYPEFMRLSIADALERSPGTHLSPAVAKKRYRGNAVFTLCVHAGIGYTEFLLQRSLINRKLGTTADLIPVSRRILSLVLIAQSKNDYFRDFRTDLIYLLAFHGLPCAGVLAIELLKTNQYPSDILPRSETIQDISVLISALSAVGPGDGNYSICNQGRRALKRALDQILSPNVVPVSTAATGDHPSMFDQTDLYFPTGNDADFLQWLDTVEWDKTNFMSSSSSQQVDGGVL